MDGPSAKRELKNLSCGNRLIFVVHANLKSIISHRNQSKNINWKDLMSKQKNKTISTIKENIVISNRIVIGSRLQF